MSRVSISIPRASLATALLLTAIALLAPKLASGQTQRDSVKIYFRQSKTAFDPYFEGNGRRFTAFSDKVRSLQRDTTVRILRVLVDACTSPEGFAEDNERIARRRAQNVAEYVSLSLGFDPDSIEVNYKIIDWPLFEQLVRNDPYVPMRSQLLPLIERRDLRRIKVERFQRTWDYLLENYFPEMRLTVVALEYMTDPADPVDADAAPEIPATEPCYNQIPPPLPDDDEPAEEYDFSEKWSWSCYVKTNLPAWGLLDENLALEVEMGRHLSFSLPVYYSAADWFSVQNKYRVFGTQPELRFWFRDNFSGPFLAMHGTFGYYNIALKKKTFRIQDRGGNTPAYGGGFNFGWKFRLNPNGSDRWGLELSVGGGYLHLDYDRFYNVENGRYSSSVVRDYFGVDHASISLTYRIGKKR